MPRRRQLVLVLYYIIIIACSRDSQNSIRFFTAEQRRLSYLKFPVITTYFSFYLLQWESMSQFTEVIDIATIICRHSHVFVKFCIIEYYIL